MLCDEEGEKVRPASTRVIDLVQFSDHSAIDPMFVDRTYYLVPVRPLKQGIVMHTLHHAAEMRGIDSIEGLDAVAVDVKPDQVKLARQVIGMFEGELDLSTFRDEYRDGLRRVIDAKIAGEDV